MAKHTIIIDGYIGNWGYSKQFIRTMLEGHEKDAVTLKISSLGGSVDHAISIFDQLVEHGNVTAELSAFVASAATLISLGAKTVRMNENAFYLIHKPMNWVDEWNYMNEDDIETLIEKLEKQKRELAKMTLQLAKMYMRKTGKSLNEIIELMKEDTWLNAEEALEWGFVDEISVAKETVNYLENASMVAMITANGMPMPVRKNDANQHQDSVAQEPAQSRDGRWTKFRKSTIDRIVEQLTKNVNSESDESNPLNITKMSKQFQYVNTALKVEKLESTAEGVFLNEKQLESIESELSLIQQVVTERDTAVADRDTANAARDTAQTDLANALSQFDAIDPTVAAAGTSEEKVAAIRALLAAKPAVAPEGNPKNEDPKDESFDGFTAAEKELTRNL